MTLLVYNDIRITLILHKLPRALPGIVLFSISNKISIERQLGKCAAITNHHQFFPGPCHGYIHAAYVRQEADLIFCIAARHPDIYNIPLLSLEAVNGVDGYFTAVSLQGRCML